MKKKVGLVLLVVAVALSLGLVAAPVGASPGLGIVGLWHLDESSGTTAYDSSGNGNDGTISGATYVSGMFEQALSFDGDDYVDCGNVLDVTNKLTVEAWVKDNGASTGNVVGKYEAMNKRWHIYVNSGADGKIYWNIGGWNYATSPTSAIGTAWHHLAMVYDGTQADNAGKLKAYIDGAPISLTYVGIIPATMPAISANVNIGRHGTSYFFNGIIDEVRIWNEALTASQIALSANGSVTWLPPVTNADFILKDGTTLPLKFQIFENGTLVTTVQPVFLEVTNGSSVHRYELGDGVEYLRWNADESYYIANLKTKDGTWTTGDYTATVIVSGAIINPVQYFYLSAEKGVGRGNSGK